MRWLTILQEVLRLIEFKDQVKNGLGSLVILSAFIASTELMTCANKRESDSTKSAETTDMMLYGTISC